MSLQHFFMNLQHLEVWRFFFRQRKIDLRWTLKHLCINGNLFKQATEYCQNLVIFCVYFFFSWSFTVVKIPHAEKLRGWQNLGDNNLNDLRFTKSRSSGFDRNFCTEEHRYTLIYSKSRTLFGVTREGYSYRHLVCGCEVSNRY